MFDFNEVRRTLDLMTFPGQVWEIRALNATWKGDVNKRWRRTLSGYFDDREKCVNELQQITAASGIYFTLNPVQPDLLARACNRLVEAEKGTATKDSQVKERRWLLVDLDPKRAQGISSSEKELSAAGNKANMVATDLVNAGWPEPIHAMSGNGCHLLWRVDLVPNSSNVKNEQDDILRRVLLGLSNRYSDDDVDIDAAVFNASRIDKLYGSLACKGDHCPELGRPHRMSRITSTPATVGIVPIHLLEAVAVSIKEESPREMRKATCSAAFSATFSATALAKPSTTSSATAEGGTWTFERAIKRVDGWAANGKIDILCREKRHDGVYYILQECPWSSTHSTADSPQDAAIIVRNDGAYGFKCFHAHCSGRRWQDVKERLGLEAESQVKHADWVQQDVCGFYYDAHRKEYLLRNGRGVWLHLTEAQFRKELAARGHRTRPRDSENVSEVDSIIIGIRDKHDVTYSGQLAGYPAGFYEVGGDRMLITVSPRIIEPKAGDFTTLDKVFSGLLDEDGFRQRDYFYGWIKVAYEALRQGNRRPGQALAIAGPHDCGKSLLQLLVTEILGGRYARPYQYMMGLTQFNSDLFEAEHLVMEDESSSTDIRARRNFGSQIKQVTVVENHRYHAKNRPALSLKPFWRLTITLNDETENLMVLPPLDDSLEDKLTILRAHKSPMPMPTETTEQRQAFWDRLVAELPGFLHWLTTWGIPTELKSNRFGIAHFQHPAILAAIDALSPESRLLSIIDRYIFADRSVKWEGTAEELEKELTGNNSDVSYEARRLFTFNTACGVYLARLSKKHPSRFQHSRGHDCRLWTIHPPSVRLNGQPLQLASDRETGGLPIFGDDGDNSGDG